jgi:hypothetical protein
VDRFDDLLCREPFARDLRDVAPPNRGDVLPVLRIGDVAVARQLVTLVPVLAPALAVALTSDGRDPASRLAVLAGRQTEVDARPHVLDTFGVVLEAAGVQQHPGLRCRPKLRRLLDAGGRHARHVLGPFWRVIAHRLSRRLEAGRVVADEVVIQPVALDDHIQHRTEQG